MEFGPRGLYPHGLARDVLDLPISTFRRHLAAGPDRRTELLWQQELAG